MPRIERAAEISWEGNVARGAGAMTAASTGTFAGMPFTLPFSPGTIRWRRTAIVELRKLGIDL